MNTVNMIKMRQGEVDGAPDGGLSLDGSIEALQAVVLMQKAQIDVLLASVEGLLATLDKASVTRRDETPQAMSLPPMDERNLNVCHPDSDKSLLGNPEDPQFASLHELMGRLKLG